jgi:gamma-glutamyl hydrolase
MQCQDINSYVKNIDKNQYPVIGILTQTYIYHSKDDHRFDDYTSFIMGAYVRFIEGAGARVVPIKWDDDEQLIKDTMSKINGVLMPGGGGNYIRAGKIVLDEAMRMNDRGEYFPIWATCLGMERMISYTATEPLKSLEKFGSYHTSLPIQFVKDPLETKMFCPFGDDSQLLTQGNYTFNAHHWSVPVNVMTEDAGLRDFWTLTSITNTTSSGAPKDFVATIEAKNYPFMAT